MKKIAIIEQIDKDGLKLLEKNSEYDYELITDVSVYGQVMVIAWCFAS